MAKKFSLKNVDEYRKSLGLNQSEFWSRFGITQSGGSRYETGRSVPQPVAMLLWLRNSGVLTDKDLEVARKAVSR